MTRRDLLRNAVLSIGGIAAAPALAFLPRAEHLPAEPAQHDFGAFRIESLDDNALAITHDQTLVGIGFDWGSADNKTRTATLEYFSHQVLSDGTVHALARVKHSEKEMLNIGLTQGETWLSSVQVVGDGKWHTVDISPRRQ